MNNNQIRLESTMSSLLEQAKRILPEKFNPIKDVNLFSILGMEHKEVSAHSAFLYYVFNPFYVEKDKIDDKNIRELYRELVSVKHNANYPETPKYFKFYREVSFAFGRLDFLIVFSDDKGEKEDALIIELKIWAGEQPNQINRYKQYLEEKGYSKNNIFFLTPTSRDSTTGESVNITLNNHITKVLERIIELRKENTPYVTIIDQYIKTIQIITEGDKMKSLNPITTSKEIKAVDTLINYRVDSLTNMLISFMKKIKEELECILEKKSVKFSSISFLDYNEDKDYLKRYYKSGYSCFPAIVIKLQKEWLNPRIIELLEENNEPDYFPCFSIEISNNLYAGTTIRYDGYKAAINSPDTKEELKNKFRSVNVTNTWIEWKHIYSKTNGKEIDFQDYNNVNTGVFRILKENSLDIKDEEAEYIAEQAFKIFEEQLNKFFVADVKDKIYGKK